MARILIAEDDAAIRNLVVRPSARMATN